MSVSFEQTSTKIIISDPAYQIESDGQIIKLDNVVPGQWDIKGAANTISGKLEIGW